MGMWLDMPGLCRRSRVNWPIEYDDSNRALRYSTVREQSDPDVQNTPTGHRGHWVWHDMGDLERCLVKITSDWYSWNEHDTAQCSRHQGLLQSKNNIGLITLQRKDCTSDVLWGLFGAYTVRSRLHACLKTVWLNIRGLFLNYVIMAFG